MFITFEGLDGSGKTTQIRLLAERLKTENHSVQVLREPGGTVISEKIREILLSKSHSEMSPIAEMLLFSSARAQLVYEIIQPLLKKNIIVICDRFVDSTTAYQGFGRGIALESISAINSIATQLLFPNITFFIDIPVNESLRRRRNSQKQLDRMEIGEEEYFHNIHRGFTYLLKNEPERFLRIDGMQTIESIHNDIWNILSRRIVSSN